MAIIKQLEERKILSRPVVQSSESIAGLARLTRRPESTEKVREALNGDSDKKVTRDAGR